MKKIAAALVTVAVAMLTGCSSGVTTSQSSPSTPKLDPTGWNPSTYESIINLVEANKGSGKIATFDFDNTTQARDVGEATVGRTQADKLIDVSTIPSTVVPPFTLAGKPITIKQGIANYYESLASINPNDNFAAYPSDNIIAQFWTGKPLSKFVSAVAAAYDNGAGKAELANGQVKLFGGLPRPFVYPQMADLYGYLRANGIDVWIVSAGVTWAVRWMVENDLNPAIRAKYGDAAQLDTAKIVGITLLLKDKRTGELLTDNQLSRVAKNPGYLALDPDVTNQLEITALPDGLNSWRGGKTGAIQNLITRDRVLLAGGDSQGDFEMLNMAENRLWITRLDKPSIQKDFAEQLKVDQPGNWMLQPTISGAPVGFLSSECELNQRLAAHPIPATKAGTEASLATLEPSGLLQSWDTCQSTPSSQ